MRTASAHDLLLLDKFERAHFARLKLERSGSWVDLTTLEGFNWLEWLQIQDDVDAPTAKLKAKLKKAQFELNLSPFMDGSKLNDPSALVDLSVPVIVELATVAIDSAPASADWREAFRGHIFAFDWAGPSIVINCRDQGGKLMDLWIETQRVYGSASGVRVELVMQDILDDNNPELDVISANYTWNATTTVTMSDTSEVVVGDFIGYLDAPFFEITSIVPNTSVTILNPSNLTIPTGSGAGSSVMIPDADRVTLYSVNGTAVDPLYYNAGGWDDSPDWLVKTFKQSKKRVLQALQSLADMIGWKIRYQWQANLDAFALVFYEPPRGNTTPDHEFSESMIVRVQKLGLSLADIRNKIKVTYGSADNRTTVEVSDSASITKYGLRAMEIAEASSSQIDGSTEANAMANAAKSDLAEPTAEAAFDVPLFWPVEVGDLHRWLANSRHFDTNQDLAVAGFTHEITTKGQAKTVLQVRGKPSGGRYRWLQKEALPGVAPAPDHYSDAAADSVAAADGLGTIIVTYDDPRTMDPPIMDWVLTRVYADTTPSFTPGAGNLRAVGRQTRFEIAGLTPGTKYYIKLELIDRAGNVSTISSEVNATVQKVGPYHENEDTQKDQLVRNPDFGVFTLGSAVPPDFWSVITGAWDTDISLSADNDGATGGNLIEFDDSGTGDPAMQSDTIPYPGDDMLDFGFKAKGGTGTTATFTMWVQQLRADDTVTYTSVLSGSCAAGVYTEFQSRSIVTDSDCSKLRVRIFLDSTTGGTTGLLDRVWIGRGLAEVNDSKSVALDQQSILAATIVVVGFPNNGTSDIGIGNDDIQLDSGNCTVGSNDTTLIDSGGAFNTLGLMEGGSKDHCVNDTDTTDVDLVSVDSATQLTTAAGGAWTSGDAYRILGQDRYYEILYPGFYRIEAKVAWSPSSGAATTGRVYIDADTGSGFSTVAENQADSQGASPWDGSVSVTYVDSFDAGDIIRVRFQSSAAGWIVEDQGTGKGTTRLQIKQLTRVE